MQWQGEKERGMEQCMRTGESGLEVTSIREGSITLRSRPDRVVCSILEFPPALPWAAEPQTYSRALKKRVSKIKGWFFFWIGAPQKTSGVSAAPLKATLVLMTLAAASGFIDA